MKIIPILAGALTLAFAGYAIGLAQTSNKNSIGFGDTVLRLGMSRNSVVSSLASSYSIDADGWVATKSGPPYEPEGQLVFKNGRLTGVWKNWFSSNQARGYELANNVYGLFKVLEHEGNTNCILSTSANQNSRGEEKAAFLFCGSKEIEVSTVRWRRGDQTNDGATLTEILKETE